VRDRQGHPKARVLNSNPELLGILAPAVGVITPNVSSQKPGRMKVSKDEREQERAEFQENPYLNE
jgi:hypothetical protein